MNQKQFEIVKIMQAIDVKPTDFAVATNTDPSMMSQAYAALSYEAFTSKSDRDRISDFFGIDPSSVGL